MSNQLALFAHSTLEKAVVKQLGLSYTDVEEFRGTMEDIRNNGIDGGFHGFIYHRDTVKFATDNKKEIVEEVLELANDLGTSGVYTMIAEFMNSGITTDEVADGFHDSESEFHTPVMNWLAWFAAGTVANTYDYS
jgi:hypothetical protein